MFNKILIANRGEIACRVIRTAKAMGVKTVAVYSDADANALHVQMADEAYRLGTPPAAESYLLIDKLIDAAVKSGAQAIHPGYGFLSENTDFAGACEKAGIVFIGPPSSAINAMGAKDTAKIIMEKANVPFVPGYHGEDQSEETICKESVKIGFPVLLKATAGGGGKGMRVVESEAEFSDAFKATKREALSSFADDNLLVEKYITKPRHIEIQVFCDGHGNGVYLFERDCSIQRRHQKVIEEAPAPNFSEELRQQMGDTALKSAFAINYVGAGTVEFLLDEDGTFYFMEMNTRLQVEHPVTEYISGQDLVEWQLIVASGGKLPLEQKDLTINGHSIEVRVYAEDPDNDFLPATGQLSYLRTPEITPDVRIDSGVQEGDTISSFYDPMISKLIVWGKDRDSAIQQMNRALDDYHIVGPTTNIDFLKRLSSCPAFAKAELDTGFIEREQEYLFAEKTSDVKIDTYCAALFSLLSQASQKPVSNDSFSPWQTYQGWRLNEKARDTLQFRLRKQEDVIDVAIEYQENGFQLQFNDEAPVQATASLEGNKLSVSIGGDRYNLSAYQVEQQVTLYRDGQRADLDIIPPSTGADSEQGGGSLKAPMNGLVIEVSVNAGDEVKQGDALITIEAMKMEHTIYSPADGTVNEVFFAVGDMVEDEAELVDFEASA